tara:strand:+ start:1488 stop:2333 length:846 start_codon:yes stop_codon:yes gene_type:complete
MTNNSGKLGFLVMLVVLIVIGNLIIFFVMFNERSSEVDNLMEPDNGLSESIQEPEEVIYYVDNLPYGVDEDDVLDNLGKAIDFWEDNENVIFTKTSSESSADLMVQWVKEFGGEHIGYSYGEIIEIGLGDSFCLDDWKQYDEDTLFLLSTHELGHFLGYEHSTDEKDVMYPELPTKFEVDIEEENVLSKGYVMFYPFCAREDDTRYSIKVDSDDDVNIYVVKSQEDYEEFLDREEFNHYSSCSEEETTSYVERCTVDYDAGIVIENPSEEPIEYSIVVKEL